MANELKMFLLTLIKYLIVYIYEGRFGKHGTTARYNSQTTELETIKSKLISPFLFDIY